MQWSKKVDYFRVLKNNFWQILIGLINAKTSKTRDQFLFFYGKKKPGLIYLFCVLVAIILGIGFVSIKPKSEDIIVNIEKQDQIVKQKSEEKLFLISIPITVKKSEAPIIIKKKQKIIQNKVEPSWRKILSSKDIKADAVKVLSTMRYRCSSYWNWQVNVTCKRRDNFCDVDFVILLDKNKYKMKYKSIISINGFDQIESWDIFMWRNDRRFDLQNKDKIIDLVIENRPKCTPFSAGRKI